MINHYDLSRILGSEIVGRVQVGHGQLEASNTQKSISELTKHFPADARVASKIDVDKVCSVFLEVRARRGDQLSPDFYIAEQERNKELIEAWQQSGIAGSMSQLNHCLMNARKESKLKGLDSKRFVIPKGTRDKLRFVCEMVATQLRYERRASVDDILCSPNLSTEFHIRCQSHVPGYSWLEYRWTILSVRKSGRKPSLAKGRLELDLSKTPFEFTDSIEAVSSKSDLLKVPNAPGILSIVEGTRDLYVAGVSQLREGIAYHSEPKILKALSSAFWMPTKPLKIAFGEVSKPYLSQVESWLISEKHPVFNVPRSNAA